MPTTETGERVAAEITFLNEKGEALRTQALPSGMQSLFAIPVGAVAVRLSWWYKSPVSMLAQMGDETGDTGATPAEPT